MADLYTKNGRPLRVGGSSVFDENGKHVGRISGKYIYTVSGRYAGTIDGDRVIYRSTDSARTVSPTAPMAGRGGSSSAPRAASAVSGEEPTFE